MSKRGFTFVEILIVMVIIGVIASFGIPRIRDSMLKVNIRSARVGFSLLAVTARQAAVARGCRGVLHITNGTSGKVWVTTCQITATGNAGTAVDTIGVPTGLASRYGVNIASTVDSIQYDPRGISIGYTRAVVTFTASGTSYTDSAVVNAIGKVTH
ncbi:MAG TPA: prepilin-type N-terminal cleavage/methylation domain-containing protein [Gemmatimonadales bacterium]|nr:prepilin-type N-terminal cleavage/methylation domain-containing protein [Gemmatimonadales bacterium]